jgi:hypothetical protein
MPAEMIAFSNARIAACEVSTKNAKHLLLSVNSFRELLLEKEPITHLKSIIYGQNQVKRRCIY